jgi:hypothetical protein
MLRRCLTSSPPGSQTRAWKILLLIAVRELCCGHDTRPVPDHPVEAGRRAAVRSRPTRVPLGAIRAGYWPAAGPRPRRQSPGAHRRRGRAAARAVRGGASGTPPSALPLGLGRRAAAADCPDTAILEKNGGPGRSLSAGHPSRTPGGWRESADDAVCDFDVGPVGEQRPVMVVPPVTVDTQRRNAGSAPRTWR